LIDAAGGFAKLLQQYQQQHLLCAAPIRVWQAIF
jgi:hypothetical protein